MGTKNKPFLSWIQNPYLYILFFYLIRLLIDMRWSYMKTVRERNIGWRIDYFIVSERIIDSVKKSIAEPSVMGSDHCPIVIELNKEKFINAR